MRKSIAFAAAALCALAVHGQEKTLCVQKTDGTCTLTRVAELSRISFLSVGDQGRQLVVRTTGDAGPVTVELEDQPELTVAEGRLVVASRKAGEPVEIEIDNIAEIRFSQGGTGIGDAGSGAQGITCVLQRGAALFRGIPEGAAVRVCTADGRSVAVPACPGGEMRLSRELLGRGIYIVRIGAFTTKITL